MTRLIEAASTLVAHVVCGAVAVVDKGLQVVEQALDVGGRWARQTGGDDD